METSTVQAIKLAVVSIVGLSRDALHVYLGLAAWLLTAVMTRRTLQSLLPLLVVLTIAVCVELIDMRDDIGSLGYWRWAASLHDIFNTIF